MGGSRNGLGQNEEVIRILHEDDVLPEGVSSLRDLVQEGDPFEVPELRAFMDALEREEHETVLSE